MTNYRRGKTVHTVYDWITIAIFAGIVTLFLQRSVGTPPPGDRIINYLPPAIGCATANYFGNNDNAVLAVALLAATLVYIAWVLKPFARD